MGKVVAIGAGNPRKPTAIKEREGTARADRANPNEPRPDPVALPKPPDGIGKQHAAAWRALAAVIDPMRITTPADVHAFELMVKSWVVCAMAEESLTQPLDLRTKAAPDHASKRKPDDPIVGPLLYLEEGVHGWRVKRRPELDIIATHSKILLYYFSRFGLTPADRSRVSELDQSHAPAAGTKGVEEFE